jgi:SAM-dependent methyltransferase
MSVIWRSLFMFSLIPRSLGRLVKGALRKILKFWGLEVLGLWSPRRDNAFFSSYYHRNTRRRLEHLASLPLSIHGSSVLEVGAGTGEHTDFFIDRGCNVTTSDARPQCLKILRSRYPKINVIPLDLENMPKEFNQTFDVVYSAGLLYHLSNPKEAIEVLSNLTDKILIISTTVSYNLDSSIEFFKENPNFELHSISGGACKPSRLWVFEQLKGHFPHVYLPTTQPNHSEFPIDWTKAGKEPLPKAIFIASTSQIDSDLLVTTIPSVQVRH